MFNPRQQLALVTFLEKIKCSYERVRADCAEIGAWIGADESRWDTDVLAKAVVGYLAIILDRGADYNSQITRWVNRGEFVGNTFTRQALPMTWDYFELNPTSGSTGDWS